MPKEEAKNCNKRYFNFSTVW